MTLAVDGWTSLKHEKRLNIVLLCEQRAIFWQTIPLEYGKFLAALSFLVLEAEGI